MLIAPLIERKRDGGRLAPAEWAEVVAGYTDGRVPDYQMAALLMAVFLKGLERDELVALTEAMLNSGARLEFADLGAPIVDKHSTGGVGDKVSLVLAPMIAACGVAVPMMSGRGLGHTGGTLDKLEAIPGFRTDLSLRDVRRQVERLGCALFGQTTEIAPADRKLYALRDVTATVESIPLIAASIMSKKLAEGLGGLLLDVKRGGGAFLTRLDDSLQLARTMIQLGEDRGCRTVALLTAMDRPLGAACGNALETAEAIAALHGRGPDDLMEVTYALGVEMLMVAGVAKDRKAAHSVVEGAITSGRAAEKFRELVTAQGGNGKVVDDPRLLPAAPQREEFSARKTGVVTRIEPRTLGRAIVAMGGGRQTVEDPVDRAVGFVLRAKPGDRVKKGDTLAVIHGRHSEDLRIGRAALESAISIQRAMDNAPLPLVSHRLTKRGVETLR
ncbi:MAG: thymidine phosphorylase [Gemmatimonadetes bacterium]|nr:thymidine phosphorylase [Gemmatimonadota bacterium]